MDFVESKLVELKETIVDDIKKEVIAFINSEGGNLYVGVADDGHVIGLDDPQSDMLRLTNMIRDTIKPDATMFVECQIEKIDTKDIVRVQVQKGTHAPYYLVGKGIRPEGVFVRQGTSSVPASEDAIRRMIKESDGDSTFIFVSKENIAFKLLQMDSEKINEIKDIEKIAEEPEKKITKVARDPEFDFIADNNYPTIIGMVGMDGN